MKWLLADAPIVADPRVFTYTLDSKPLSSGRLRDKLALLCCFSPMNIQLLSDLHLEENVAFQPQPAPDADLLVLAGDIGSYQRGSALPALSDTDFGLAPGTAGFCNALDDLLPLADVWLHGHLHCAIDYRDASGRCRVVANPLGYADKGEQAAFKPRWLIEVPRGAPRPAI